MKTLLDIDGMADFLQTDKPTVLKLARRGDIPQPITIGDRLVRWTSTDIDRWIDAGCPAGVPPKPRHFDKWRVLNYKEKVSRCAVAYADLHPDDCAVA